MAKQCKIINFNKLDEKKKAKMRVAIAQDVLSQIELGKIKARTGVFLSSSSLEDARRKTSKAFNLQPIFKKIHKNNPCAVCAKGSLFFGLVNKFNQIKDNGVSDCGSDEISWEYIKKHLTKVFSLRQLDLIEMAFEGRVTCLEGEDGRYDNDETGGYLSEFQVAYNWRDHHFMNDKTETWMLSQIMKNIIHNKGTFKPSRIKNRAIKQDTQYVAW